MYKIIFKEKLNEFVTHMKVKAPYVTKHAKVGQFIMLRVDKDGERIPLTIVATNKEVGSVSIIFQIVGKTTYHLNQLKVHDAVHDFAGPLGTPTKIEGLKKVLVIGGGVGCAIAYPLCRELTKQSTEVDAVIGFKSKSQAILVNEFKNATNKLSITTDDGSLGSQGFVTDELINLLDEGHIYDHVFAIGPIVMMKKISEITKKFKIPTTVSLNPIMIDGTGMCGGCRVKVGEEVKFACVDGPDFNGHLVDFDLLQSRNQMYMNKENKDYQKCKSEGDTYESSKA